MRVCGAARVAALLPVLVWVCAAQRLPDVQPSVYRAPASGAARAELPRRAAGVSGPTQRLDPLQPGEAERVQPRRGTRAAGVHRRLPEEWRVTLSPQQTWQRTVQSPGAASVRLHFEGFDLGSGRVWVHDGTGRREGVGGPYTGRGPLGDGDFWSELVPGDTVTVEVEPDPARASTFRLGEISHLWESAFPMQDASALPKLPVVGGQRELAASCSLDVSCHPEWAESALAVARIAFETDEGSFLCSGSLLQTRMRSSAPYFLTADHCVSRDSEARTVEALWTYQTSACNGTPPRLSGQMRALGAFYLAGAGTARGDYTLLQMASLPDGVVFAGWSSDDPDPGSTLTTIHHPDGDYKRITFGERGPDLTSLGPAGRFYRVREREGRTEGGSSGSPLFVRPGIVVGVLSNGDAPPRGRTVCDLNLPDNFYGRFNVVLSGLRPYLEDRVPGAPVESPSTGGDLPFDELREFALPASPEPRLFAGDAAHRITVPEGVTRLEVRVVTDSRGADVDLHLRRDRAPELVDGQVVADASSARTIGNETIVLTPQSTPPLRPGTYFVALAGSSPGQAASGVIVASLRQGPPSGPSTNAPLASGVPVEVRLTEVEEPSLFGGPFAQTIEVPKNATSLTVRMASENPEVDVDLYVRSGAAVEQVGQRIVADHASEGPTGNETITITRNSAVPLRPGTYHVAMSLFSTGEEARVTLTATVETEDAVESPAVGTLLASGVAVPYSLPAVTQPMLFGGERVYRIEVPAGARLEVKAVSSTPDADVDLYVRFGTPPTWDGQRVTADFSSTTDAPGEAIVVTPTTIPALQAGVYYIALSQFKAGVEATGTVVATVTMGQ